MRAAGRFTRTIKNVQPQMNMVNIDLGIGDLIPRGQSQFLYLWTGFNTSDESQ